jgi:hypothetical protein
MARIGEQFKGASTALLNTYDRAIDAVLLRPREISTAEEALAALRADASWNADALTGQIQKTALVVTPLLRRFRMVGKAPGVRRVPTIAVVTTVATVSTQLWAGIKEVQVLAALIATRLRQEGLPADPPLVKRLAIELYTKPDQTPTLESVRTSINGVLARWAFAGVFGRDTSKRARKAFVAAERLDLREVVAKWPPAQAAVSGPTPAINPTSASDRDR